MKKCRQTLVIRRSLAVWLSARFRLGPPAAQQAATRPHVEALAAEKLDGRLTGSAGERLAADYIVSQLQRIGATPVPGLSDFRVPFEFTSGTRDGGSRVGIKWVKDGTEAGVTAGVAPGNAGDNASSVRALSFSDNGEVEAGVVFAGYGIVVPDSQDFGYDSYAGLDVKDKIVLVLRYFPEDADQKTKGILARYSDLRYKAMAARQHGAKAILVVTGPRSPNAGELAPMSFDTAIAGSGIVAASCHRRFRPAILPAGERQDARLGATITRYRKSARVRLRASWTDSVGSHHRRS